MTEYTVFLTSKCLKSNRRERQRKKDLPFNILSEAIKPRQGTMGASVLMLILVSPKTPLKEVMDES